MFEDLTDKLNLESYSGIIEGHKEACILLTNRGDSSLHMKQFTQVGCVSSAVEEGWFRVSGEVGVVILDSRGTDVKKNELDSTMIKLPNYLSRDKQDYVREFVSNNLKLFENKNHIGKFDIEPHRIELTDSTPIYQRARRFPEVINSEIERQCKELELLDVIEPSTSAWSSPVVPSKKKDGTIRLCVDYRKLNTVTKADKFPIPNLNDAVFGLGKVKYFSALDLVKGYYQFPLEEKSKKFTAFSTPRHHWQFKRLSFGLKNAPSAFQRGMQQILSGYNTRIKKMYYRRLMNIFH